MPLEVVCKNICSTVGEGPYWDEDLQLLYFVDIYARSVSRWHAEKGNVQKITLDKTIGFVIPSKKGDVIIGLGQSFSRLEWDTENVTLIRAVDQDKQTRMNDGKCDPKGRLWAGTMGMETVPGIVELGQGSLYCLETDGKVSRHLENLNIPNGIVWSADEKTMYFIDSIPGIVYAFDYDIVNASIKNQKIIFQCQPKPHNTLGTPDGMTIDKDGKLWIAFFFGGRIIQFDPDTGNIMNTQHIPAMSPTSCCFGGGNFDQLYVTSSRHGITDEESALYPLSGSVFRITDMGTCGHPSAKYDG